MYWRASHGWYIGVWRRTPSFFVLWSLITWTWRRPVEAWCSTHESAVFEDVYGDCVQALHLLDCHNKMIIYLQGRQLKDAEVELKGGCPNLLDGIGYKNWLVDECNNAFKRYIQVCYINHFMIHLPILTRETTDALVDSYKVKILPHYEYFYRMFGSNFQKAG